MSAAIQIWIADSFKQAIAALAGREQNYFRNYIVMGIGNTVVFGSDRAMVG